ncbi:MAG: hypothetical protein M2R45_04934 [Verrucomicrobia subdivision 3 bacterium]|nr:hypothetical protein [Limisphaerales bacterium]
MLPSRDIHIYARSLVSGDVEIHLHTLLWWFGTLPSTGCPVNQLTIHQMVHFAHSKSPFASALRMARSENLRWRECHTYTSAFFLLYYSARA